MDTKLKTHLTGSIKYSILIFLYMGQFLKAMSVLTLYLKCINQMFWFMYFCKIIDKFGDLKNFDIGEEIKM